MVDPTTTDTAGINTLFRLIQDLSNTAPRMAQDSNGGFEFGIKTLVVLLLILVLAVIALSIVIGWVFVQWRKDQKAGVRALSTSKDATRKEITDILKTELGNARAANLADIAKIVLVLDKLGSSVNLIVLDLALIGHKLKMPMRSSPTEVTKEPPKEGG
jgi:hypothetical protein